MARTRAQDYDAKRLAILHHSARLFAEQGYAGTSINSIATACGVSKALLYHYYPDKESVLFDILSNHLRRLLAAVEAVEPSARGPHDHLRALSSTLLDAYRDADAEHQVQIAGLRLLPAEKQEALRAVERRIVDIFSAAVAAVVPDVSRGPLLKPITMSLFGMLNWHYLWFREGKGLTRDDYAALVTQLVAAGAPSAATLADPALAALGTTAAGERAPRPGREQGQGQAARAGKRPVARPAFKSA